MLKSGWFAGLSIPFRSSVIIFMGIAVFDLYIVIWVYVTSCICLASQPTMHLAWQDYFIGHYRQTLQPNVFIPAMLIGSFNFYDSIPLPVTKRNL